jgi:hypothetical protein
MAIVQMERHANRLFVIIHLRLLATTRVTPVAITLPITAVVVATAGVMGEMVGVVAAVTVIVVAQVQGTAVNKN